MPSRNRLKNDVEDSYYHVYNRGINKQNIFIDNEDFRVFLNLIKRYLSDKPQFDAKGREYKWLYEDVELLSYCLMPNHFHLFLHQNKRKGMFQLLHSVCSSYTTYFNKKYGRIGPLFQDRYKASLITNDGYLQHISRYIHLNPKNFKHYKYSSYKHIVSKSSISWLSSSHLLSFFDDEIEDYIRFLDDLNDYQESFDEIKFELADH